MADSWEDDDFEVPSFTAPVSVPANWEEEDEVELDEKPVATKPSQAVLDAKKKKDEQEAFALEQKLKELEISNETAEQKKLREKKQIEEADHELTGELFGGKVDGVTTSVFTGVTAAKGVAGIVLKTKQDHLNFGQTCSQKLSTSSAFNVAAFYKGLSDCLKNSNSETLDEILATIGKIREEKVKLEKPVKQVAAKKSKKDLKKVAQAHADKFGASDYVDKYDDEYGNLEDDFM